MTDEPTIFHPENIIAMAFHTMYEVLAPDFQYESRAESRTAWENVPPQNRVLMTATVKALIDNKIIAPGAALAPDKQAPTLKKFRKQYGLQGDLTEDCPQSHDD